MAERWTTGGENKRVAFSPTGVHRVNGVFLSFFRGMDRDQRGFPPRIERLSPRKRRPYNNNGSMNKHLFEDVLRRYGLSEAYAQQEAVRLWPLVAGQLAKLANAMYVEEGTLHIAAVNATVAHELRFLAEELIRRLNRRLQGRTIRQLKIRIDPGAPAPRPSIRRTATHAEDDAQQMFSAIPDSDLQNLFVKLYVEQRNWEETRLGAGARRCTRCGIVYEGRTPICPGCRYDGIEPDSAES